MLLDPSVSRWQMTYSKDVVFVPSLTEWSGRCRQPGEAQSARPGRCTADDAKQAESSETTQDFSGVGDHYFSKTTCCRTAKTIRWWGLRGCNKPKYPQARWDYFPNLSNLLREELSVMRIFAYCPVARQMSLSSGSLAHWIEKQWLNLWEV